jgi:hypothetical protein
MSRFIAVTYWWGRGKICKNSSYDYSDGYEKRVKPLLYEQLADRWMKQMKILNIKYYIEERNEFSKPHLYQKGIAYKPKFIQKCLKKFKCPVVYIDMDMRIHKYPHLFENNKFDCMLFNWNIDTRYIDNVYMFTLETSGGLFYFNYTYTAIRMLQLWYNYLNFNKYLGKADDRIFSICFKENNMLHWSKTYWLPAEYFFIPEYFFGSINHNNVVISHPMRLTPENNAHKLGSSNNRIPYDYHKVIKTGQKSKHINEFFYHHFDNKKQQKHYSHLNHDLVKNKIKNIIQIDQLNYRIRNKIHFFDNSLSHDNILKLFNKCKCTLKSNLLKSKNIRDYDIIFNSSYEILFFKPSVLSVKLLNDFQNFKNKKNMSYVLGLRYTFDTYYF